MAKNSNHFEAFGLKPIPKRVLLDIVSHGTSTVADMAARLNMPKSSVYDALASLLDKSLVNEYSDDRGKSFGVSDAEQLARAHAQKIAELQLAQTELLSLIKHKTSKDDVAKPRVRFYAGDLGIKQAFRDMPWSAEHKESYLMWPMKDMLKSVDEEFLLWHGKQRFQYGVVLNVIEKEADRSLQKSGKSWLVNDLKNNLCRIKYLPKGMDWKMSYWIYGNKCLLASSGDEKIAFTIHSKEFCNLMKLMWQIAWERAKA